MAEQHSEGIREINLTLPVTQADIESLTLGDAVYLNGLVFTGREGVYHQIFEKEIEPPIDIRTLGGATFHCSPAICETSPGVYNVPSVTATASFRFAKYMPKFLKRYGIRIVIGKGGQKLKEIGQAARQEIERMVGVQVFLKLFVRVQKNWSTDTKALRRFGY